MEQRRGGGGGVVGGGREEEEAYLAGAPDVDALQELAVAAGVQQAGETG